MKVRVLGCAVAGACLVVGAAMADEMQGQPLSLPLEVVSAATAFNQYMTSAARIDAGFSDGTTVAQALKTASGYETSQMEEGMIAYGAVVALQDQRFVEGVERAGGRGDDRAAMAEQLIEDPFAVTRVDGADEAAGRIAAALSNKASALLAAGDHVRTAAYSVQHQAWSKVMVGDAQARLADVKLRSNERASPSQSDDEAMLAALDDAAGGLADDDQARFTPIETRALALAAESVLGHAHGADRDRLTPLFSDADSAECLRMSKLNLYQCMAVAGPQYEDIYCMGQHALTDTAKCVAGAAQVPDAQMASLATRPSGGALVPVVAHRSLQIDPD